MGSISEGLLANVINVRSRARGDNLRQRALEGAEGARGRLYIVRLPLLSKFMCFCVVTGMRPLGAH